LCATTRDAQQRPQLPEQPFRKLLRFLRNVSMPVRFPPRIIEEDEMKKFGFVLAAVGALAVAVPSIASAETVVIKRGGHDRGMRHDRGWHRGWHHDHDRTVVIRRDRY
jgi:hypothetical protein